MFIQKFIKKLVKISDENTILFKNQFIEILQWFILLTQYASGELIENDLLNFVLNFTNKKIPLIIDEAYIDYSSKISNCIKINIKI